MKGLYIVVCYLLVNSKLGFVVYNYGIYFSEILYPKDGYSPHSCVSSDLLCRGRDFVVGDTFKSDAVNVKKKKKKKKKN